MLTEDEARKKWCPQSFAAIPVINEYGAEVQCSGPWVCKASECMAWRWFTHQREKDGQIWSPTGPYSATGTKEHTGYCGLAGAP